MVAGQFTSDELAQAVDGGDLPWRAVRAAMVGARPGSKQAHVEAETVEVEKDAMSASASKYGSPSKVKRPRVSALEMEKEKMQNMFDAQHLRPPVQAPVGDTEVAGTEEAAAATPSTEGTRIPRAVRTCEVGARRVQEKRVTAHEIVPAPCTRTPYLYRVPQARRKRT